jgi:hypothetical protein
LKIANSGASSGIGRQYETTKEEDNVYSLRVTGQPETNGHITFDALEMGSADFSITDTIDGFTLPVR